MMTEWISHYGYLGIASLLTLGIVGLPVPDETLLTLVGYLASKGDLHIVPAVAASACGSMLGISLSYLLGRTGGVYLVKRYGPFLHLTEERLEKAHAWFGRTGKWSLVLGYFVPGVRHLTAYVVGTTKLRYPLFALFAYSGAILWSGTFISIGYFFGKEWRETGRLIHGSLLIGMGVAAAAALLYAVFAYLRHRGKEQR